MLIEYQCHTYMVEMMGTVMKVRGAQLHTVVCRMLSLPHFKGRRSAGMADGAEGWMVAARGMDKMTESKAVLMGEEW